MRGLRGSPSGLATTADHFRRFGLEPRGPPGYRRDVGENGAGMHRIEDWDEAYANAPHIPGGDRWPEAWVAPARAFREAHPPREVRYGDHARQRMDLFLPDDGAPRGLVVFVHGGYWVRFDRSFWSHLAAGPLARGWAVAVPSYVLAPEARVAAIGRAVAVAVETAAREVAGPIRLVGHSAGGHLVTRLAVGDALPEAVARRVERVVSISGVHDLRPLLRTRQNDDVRLDAVEARAESPALLVPREGTRCLAWVGQAERSEFVRQSELIASVWRGLGAATACVIEPDRHHFDVIDGLARPDSPLTDGVLA